MNKTATYGGFFLFYWRLLWNSANVFASFNISEPSYWWLDYAYGKKKVQLSIDVGKLICLAHISELRLQVN